MTLHRGEAVGSDRDRVDPGSDQELGVVRVVAGALTARPTGRPQTWATSAMRSSAAALDASDLRRAAPPRPQDDVVDANSDAARHNGVGEFVGEQ